MPSNQTMFKVPVAEIKEVCAKDFLMIYCNKVEIKFRGMYESRIYLYHESFHVESTYPICYIPLSNEEYEQMEHSTMEGLIRFAYDHKRRIVRFHRVLDAK